jgi:hypothetical protein
MVILLALLAQPVLAKRPDGVAREFSPGHAHADFLPPGQAKRLAAEDAPPPAAPEPSAPEPSPPEFAAPTNEPPAQASTAPVPPAVTEEAPGSTVPASQPSPEPPSYFGADAAASDTSGDAEISLPVVVHGPPASPLPVAQEHAAPAPQLNIPAADGLSTWPGAGLALGAALGASAAAIGVRVLHANRAPTGAGLPKGPKPAAPLLDLAGLLRRVELNPFDGEARFRLGLELLERGRDAEALRFLAQAFRYHPQAIIEILREPRLAHVRNHAGVRQILRRFQRETSRRLWTGYS